MAVIVGRLGRSETNVPINLLPSELISRQRMRKVLVGVTAGAVGLIVVLATVTLLQRQAISSAKRDLAFQQTEAARLQGEVGSLREFGDMKARIDTTKIKLGAVLKNDIAWSEFLADLAIAMPADAWLSSLQLEAGVDTTPEGEPSLGTVKYDGFVQSFPGLAGWLTRMSELKGLRFVYLNQGQKDSNGVVGFNADAHLTETMLSGRCQGKDAPCP